MLMNRSLIVLRGSVTAVRERFAGVTRQSERTLLLGTVLLASAASAATTYLLAQSFSVDVLSSHLFFGEDCWGDWDINIGRHCFGDYAMVVGAGMRPNPWEPYPMPPPFSPLLITQPVSITPHLLFGAPANWLGVPRLGLIAYLLALTIAVLSPAVWAARGARGLERVVVFVALGAAAIPAWAVIDRGNSVGFVVPIALVFLVALRRQRWGLVAIMVILAAIVKPQYVVLAVALLAARQWRLGGLAVAGAVISNLAGYLLWPQHLPESITQSIHNLIYVTGHSFGMLTDMRNVSFSRAPLLFPDYAKLIQTGGKLPEGFLAGPRWMIGLAVLIVVVVAVLALGRRIPPVMVGVVLLTTTTLSPPLALFYHLVFVLPVAALVVRDPDGPPGTGMFDRLVTLGDRRRAVGISVSLAAALSIAQIALPGLVGQADIPGQTGTRGIVGTTLLFTPFLWLLACAVILVSYARRRAPLNGSDQEPYRDGPPDTVSSASSCVSEPTASSPQRSASSAETSYD
jgi:hypothetical protein